MKGSLQVKGGKYYAVFNIKNSEGKKSTKWINTGYSAPKERKKAEKFLKIKELELDTEPLCNESVPNTENNLLNQPVISFLTPNGQIMFAQNVAVQPKPETLFFVYIQEWLKAKRTNSSIDVVTYEHYESICNNHLIPYFKKKKVFWNQLIIRIFKNT